MTKIGMNKRLTFLLSLAILSASAAAVAVTLSLALATTAAAAILGVNNFVTKKRQDSRNCQQRWGKQTATCPALHTDPPL